MDPIEDPIYIAAIQTIASYPLATNIGISIGYKAMVSSANPKVVPPKAISDVTNTTNKNSFPFVLFDEAAIPASNVPVLLTKPIIPPKIRTKP